MFTCSNLVIFPGVGSFEQLFGPVRGKFKKKFKCRGGMLKLRFDWYIIIVIHKQDGETRENRLKFVR